MELQQEQIWQRKIKIRRKGNREKNSRKVYDNIINYNGIK